MPDPYLDRRLARQDRNAHIRDTAERLFCSRGFGATGVDRIADESGITKVTLYRHFPAKVAIVLAVLEDLHRRRLTDLAETAAAPAGAPRARLRAVFDSLRTWLEETGYAGCTFVRATVETARDMPAVQELAARHKRLQAEVLTQLARDSGAADPDLLGRQLAVLIEGATTLAMIDGDITHVDDAESAANVLFGHRTVKRPGGRSAKVTRD